jgi:transcriptional regulator with XRE-family HTH domain
MPIIRNMSKRTRRTTRPTVSEQLRRIIDGCGLTRYEIAKRTGVEQSQLSRFMAGERGLSTATLDALGKLLDLEIIGHGPEQDER